MLCPFSTIAALISHIYPGIQSLHPPSYFQECCLLAPRNMETSEINTDVLSLFPGEEYHLWAIDHALDPETFAGGRCQLLT